MKIGLNTYSFRKELEKSEYSLEQVWQIADKIGFIEGIELLDRHIPGWPNGNLNKGIGMVVEQLESYNYPVYGLGPHFKIYQRSQKAIQTEVEEIKRWVDLAASYGIMNIRAQVGGPLKFDKNFEKHLNRVKDLLDLAIPYAEKNNTKICIETHHRLSSWPPFLEQITKNFEGTPALGINFDWGNFPNNEQRYEALEIATKPFNHAHNHVKIFRFGENFQEKKYDSMKIVKAFKDANFKDYFSIEFEGRQHSVEGVYKSVHALQYAITEGSYKINLEFDWKSLIP